MMLSEGRPGIHSKYSLYEGKHNFPLPAQNPRCRLKRIGILRLELPKEVYERTGLTGKVIRDGGRKHMKTRYGTKTPPRPYELHQPINNPS